MKNELLILTGAGFSTAFLEPIDIVKNKFGENAKLTTQFITDSIINKDYLSKWESIFEKQVNSIVQKYNYSNDNPFKAIDGNDIGFKNSKLLFELSANLYEELKSKYEYNKPEIIHFETIYYLIEELLKYDNENIFATIYDKKKKYSELIPNGREAALDRFTEYILSIVNYFSVSDENKFLLNNYFAKLFNCNNIQAYTLNYDNATYDSIREASENLCIELNTSFPYENEEIRLTKNNNFKKQHDSNNQGSNSYFNLHGSVNFRIESFGKFGFCYTEPGKYVMTNLDPLVPYKEFGYRHNDFYKKTMITGYDKERKTNVEPYLSIFQSLQINLETVNEIIIIGFSFGDSHINNLLKKIFPNLNDFEKKYFLTDKVKDKKVRFRANKKLRKISIVGFCNQNEVAENINKIVSILSNSIIPPSALEINENYKNENILHQDERTVLFKFNDFELFFDFRGAKKYIESQLNHKMSIIK